MLKVTLMGTGFSEGVPNAVGNWGACDPTNQKNKRDRVSVMVQSETTNVLIDAPYELRHQLIRHDITRIDHAIVTHAHADHISGLDDLRSFFRARKDGSKIDTYLDADCYRVIHNASPHMFPPGFEKYPPFMEPHIIEYGDTLQLGDIPFQTFEQDHGTCSTIGLRTGDFAYSIDVKRLNETALNALKGVKIWVVDCLSITPRNALTHADFETVQEWIDIIRPEITYLTGMDRSVDYDDACHVLPPHVRPAYDGMEIIID